MKYAVIGLKGKQYLVEEGQEVVVDKMSKEDKSAEVYMVRDGEKIKVGDPLVKDAKVSFKVITDSFKGEKVEVRKYKAKSRYRKHIGFRPQLTRIKVEKISA